MEGRLDATAFPHIFERVRAHAPYELLIRLRLVNRASLAFANRILFEHVAFTHKEGLIEDPSRKEVGAPSKVYARSLSGRSPSLCALPLPPLAVGLWGKPTVPEHSGWAHTRVIDIETSVRVLGSYHADDAEFPALHTLRRRTWIPDVKPTHTFLDVLRVPSPGTYDSCINVPTRGVERHVLLVLYDPAWPGLAAPFAVRVPFWDASAHAVIIFRPCPRDELFTAPRLPLQDPESSETFLLFFLRLVAERYHRSYTLVGLDQMPPAILATELGLISDDFLLAAAHQSTGDSEQWPRLVSERAVEAMRALHADVDEFLSDDEEPVELDDMVEVLTLDEYRVREGEEVWECETYGDALPAALGA